ncbi:hypothetical protein scyTo_0003055 [Scyliorhinus torazame]|uniref:Uncharacterized protein n=1 Tax=Scyliorhinus torazame TaxID=75743 RepID=A0A401PLK3_SCYTO|nr:hypothetical protein [Scyliorhinus torazame]
MRAMTPTKQRYVQIEKECLDLLIGSSTFIHHRNGRAVSPKEEQQSASEFPQITIDTELLKPKGQQQDVFLQ